MGGIITVGLRVYQSDPQEKVIRSFRMLGCLAAGLRVEMGHIQSGKGGRAQNSAQGKFSSLRFSAAETEDPPGKGMRRRGAG